MPTGIVARPVALYLSKFRAKDGRDVSFHVYYQSQQQRLVKALGLNKKAEEYGFFSLKKDMKEIAANVDTKNAMELEDLSFSCGACGFSSPPVINTAFPMNEENLVFTDGNSGWTQR